MTCDIWHVTSYMSHMTCDMWGEVKLSQQIFLSSFCTLEGRFVQLMNEWNNHKGVSTTALATPGLVNRLGWSEIDCPQNLYWNDCKLHLSIRKSDNTQTNSKQNHPGEWKLLWFIKLKKYMYMKNLVHYRTRGHIKNLNQQFPQKVL